MRARIDRHGDGIAAHAGSVEASLVAALAAGSPFRAALLTRRTESRPRGFDGADREARDDRAGEGIETRWPAVGFADAVVRDPAGNAVQSQTGSDRRYRKTSRGVVSMWVLAAVVMVSGIVQISSSRRWQEEHTHETAALPSPAFVTEAIAAPAVSASAHASPGLMTTAAPAPAKIVCLTPLSCLPSFAEPQTKAR